MISRRILAAVALLCALGSPAHAQSTKAQLNTEITTTFPDNTSGQITASGLRTVTKDIVNSIMPASPVVSGNLACFNGTTGLLQDCGTVPVPGLGTAGYALTGNGLAAPTYQGFLQAGTGAVTRTWQDKARDSVSVKDFGTVCDGVTDDTASIQSAITYAVPTGKTVILPAGTCQIAGTVTIGGNGTALQGAGVNSTILRSPNASNPILSVGNGLAGIRLSGFQLNRSVPATAGGDGIQWALTGISDGFLDNIWVRNSYVGFKLGPTALSYGRLLRAEGNVSHGIMLTNNSVSGGNQWTMDNIYVGNNGGDGFSIRSDALAVAGMGTGNMTNLYSFQNTGHGFAAIGTAASTINAVRMKSFFLGEDGASELYLDTRGGGHQLSDGFLELAGVSPTGPGQITAPSGVGHGIEITANNIHGIISDVFITGMSQSGLVNTASSFMSIDHVFSANNSNYGVVLSDGAKASLSDSYLTNNTSGSIFITANSASLQSTGNTPITINNTMLGTAAATSIASSGPVTVTSNSGSSLAVGRLGATTPALVVDSSAASQAAGIAIQGAATGSTVTIRANDSGANTPLAIDARGSGTVSIAGGSTGAIILNRATSLLGALTYGGVTANNAVTGTGNLPLSNGPTLDSPIMATRVVKGVYVIGASAVQVSLTGTVVETTLATIAVPANVMGANGIIRVTAQMSYSGGTAAWQTLIKHGGTTYINISSANTLPSARFQTQVANRNATNSQVGTSISQANWAGNAAAVVTGSADTTSSQNILINGILTNATDTMKLESYLVELIVP